MRAWILAAVAAALGIGGAFGWILRGEPREVVKIVERPVRVAAAPPVRAQRFPDYPKPRFQLPPPETSESGALPALDAAMPPAMIGDLPRLPTADPGDSAIALSPEPSLAPTADLNADEALARRIVLQGGGEIVSSADAKDASGKVGRALVAETSTASRENLRASLRRALGDRAVLSDGGAVEGESPDLRKAEAELDAARRQRDKARLDFMPEAPALRQIEEDYARTEKTAADLRKASARVRLNILLRPVLAS